MAEKKLVIPVTTRDLASKQLDKVGKTGEKAGKSIAFGFIKAQAAIALFRTGLRAVSRLLRSITTDAAEEGDKFAKMAKRLGVPIETLSAMDHVARLAGTSIENVGNSLKLLAKNAYDASRDTGEAKDAFKELGISVTESDGSIRGVNDLLLEVADKFEGITDESLKAAYAQRIFGRSGLDMKIILDQGSAAISRQIEQAKRYGGVWDLAMGTAAEAFQDARTRLDLAIRGVRNAIAVELFPAITKGLEKAALYIADNREKIKEAALKVIRGVAEFMIDAVSVMLVVIGDLKDIVERVSDFMKRPLQVLGGEKLDEKVMRLWKQTYGTPEERAAAEKAGMSTGQKWAQSFATGAREFLDAHIPEVVQEAEGEARQLAPITVTATPSFIEGLKSGVKEAIAEMVKLQGSVQEFGRQIGMTLVTQVSQGFSTFFDAIIFGSKSAGEAFRAFGLDVLRTLQQIATQRVVAQILNSVLGFNFTPASAATYLDSLQGPPTAAGGVATRPQMRLVGESGPEAIVPLRKAGDFFGGGGINITVNAPSNVDGNAVKALARAGVQEALRFSGGFRADMRRRLREGL